MRVATVGGLPVELLGEEHGPGTPVVVLLHGYDGFPGDLSPFASSFGLPFRFAFPEGPVPALEGGRGGHAWWPIDDEGRNAALARGEPRDLSSIDPPGLAPSRAQVVNLLDELDEMWGPSSLIIGGFSQGAMLSCDLALTTNRPLAGLVQLAGARIRKATWASVYASRRGLPVFIAHGRSDPDLSFRAAEQLRDDFVAAGLDVNWVAFDGGHEVPLLALRGLKRFLARYVADRDGE